MEGSAANDTLLDEMTAFISENETAASGTDDDGLPFEPFDAFSTDPVEFGEMSARMLAKVENIFDLTRLYNRHSAKYLKAFGLLERGIRQLGSVCVTKSAMEEYKFPQPELGQLTTQKLYRMASFNYRKLDTALTERLEKANDLYPELTDAFMRCFNLLNRLRATERKIYSFFDKKYFGKEDESPAVEGLAFSKKSWSKRFTSEREEAPAFRSAPAFPIIQNAEVRNTEEIRKKKSEIRNKAADDQKSEKNRNLNSEIRNIEAPASEAVSEELKGSEPQVTTKSGSDCPEGASGTEQPKSPVIEENEENEVIITGTAEGDQFPERKETSAGTPDGIRKDDDPPDGWTPPCIAIIRNAVQRSDDSEGGMVTFTYDEILALADDPYLDIVDHELAVQVRQSAAAIRSG